MRARALMVAPEPFFEPRGTPLSVYYRTLVLTELGVEVDLICYGQGEDVDLPGVRVLRIPRFEFLGRVGAGPSALKALLDIPLSARAYARLLSRRYDFVHVHEEASFLCWPLLLAGPKLVYDMHSSLPNQLVAYRWQRFPLLVPLLRRYERFCLRRADAVITISPGLARHARALVANPDRHLLIENSIFDPIRTRRSPDPDQASRWLARVPEGRVIVAYTGTFEPYQGLDLLIEATALARRRDPRLFLLLVGGEPSQVESHQALAARAGLHEHSLFTGPFDQASVEVILERAQVLASPRKDGTSTPLKLYRWLASGRPIVATRMRAHTDVLDDAISFLVDPDPRAFAEGLLAAARGDQESRRRTEAALEVYRSRYSRPSYVAKMQELLGLLGL